MDDQTLCCLCNYASNSEDDLAQHIDNFHSDIFRVCFDEESPQISAQNQNTTFSIAEENLSPMPEPHFSAPPAPATKRSKGRSRSVHKSTRFKGKPDSRCDAVVAGKRKISETLTTDGDDDDCVKKSKVSTIPKPAALISWPEHDVDTTALRKQIEQLQRDLESARTENSNMKRDFEATESDLNKNLSEAKLKNMDLEKNLAEVNLSNDQLDQENRDLTEKLKKIMDLFSQQRDTLKAKTTELCKVRMSEGRLTIETNKLKSDIATFNSKFEACVIKFNKDVNAARSENEKLRIRSGYFERIKKSFEKATQKDDEFCGVSLKSESFSSLTDEELCCMIENFIVDAFESLLERCVDFEQTSMAMKQMNSTIESKNALLKQLTSQLDVSCMRLQSQKADIRSLRFREKDLTDKLTSSEKTNKLLQDDLSLEKRRGQKVAADLKMEIFELDKAATRIKAANVKLLEKEKDMEDLITNLKKTLAENATTIERHQADSDGKSRMIGALKTEVSELASIVVSLQEKTTAFVRREIDTITEMAKLKQDLKDSETKVVTLTKETEAIREQHLEELKRPTGLEEELKEAQALGLELRANNEMLAKQNSDLDALVSQLNSKINKIESELKAAKKSNAELKAKVNSEKPELKALQYELKEKDKLIKTLQKNNDSVDADLDKARKDKAALEFKMNQLNQDLKKKESEYFEALKKHSENLSSMKTEVVKVIELKDKEIEDLKQQLESNNAVAETGSKEAEKLLQKLAILKEKATAAEREKAELVRKLREMTSDKKASEKKFAEMEADNAGLASELKAAEEEAEKLRQELERNLARAHDLSKYNELVMEARQLAQERDRLVHEVQKRNEVIETSTKESLQKTIRIETLEIETKSLVVKMKCLNSERQKNLDDLARAQEFCLRMDRQILDLESQLAKFVTPVKVAETPAEPAHEGVEPKKPVVTLKIRKDLLA